MQKYAFVFGHRPLLSLAELEAYLGAKKIKWYPRRYGNGILIIELEKEIPEPQEILNQLGGTVKLVRILEESPSTLTTAREHIHKEITAETLLEKYFIQQEKKIFFGFSLYPLAPISSKDLQVFLRTYGVDVKRELRKQEINSRFVVGKNPALSSVIVQKNKLLSRGAEIDIIFDKQYLAIGKTVAVQDFDDYGLRDYGRPKADPKKGMIPPKLAQILLNLARLTAGKVMLDSFCGVGTVLQEALLKDFLVIGTDIDPEMVKSAQKNLDWLIDTYKLELTNIKKLETVDAKYLNKHIKSGSVDAVVSELTLGPAMLKTPTPTAAKRNIEKLTRIFSDTFKSLHGVLKPKGIIVITLPYYILPKERLFMPILDNISQLGYTLKEPFSDELREKLRVKPTERGTLLYERPRQIVGREVVILRKSKK